MSRLVGLAATMIAATIWLSGPTGAGGATRPVEPHPKPLIVRVAAAVTGPETATLEAVINPRGRRTTVELDVQTPFDCVEGAACSGSATVFAQRRALGPDRRARVFQMTMRVTPGCTYPYWVTAHNSRTSNSTDSFPEASFTTPGPRHLGQCDVVLLGPINVRPGARSKPNTASKAP